MNPPTKRRKKTVRLFDSDGSLIDLPSVLALMDAWSDAALLVSEERLVLATNATLRRFLGAHPDAVIGLDAYELLFPDGGAPDPCPLELAVQEGLERHTAMWERLDTGRWLEASITLTPFVTRKKNRVYLFRQRDVSDREEVLEQIKLRTQELEALRDLLLLDPAVPLNMLLQLALERLVDLSWLGVQRRGIVFLADASGNLTMRAAVGLSTSAINHCAHVPAGTCICGSAAAARELVYSAEVGREHSRRHDDIQPHGHYCVPFSTEDRLLGVLTFYLPAGHRRSRREEAFLRSAASVVGVMVERAHSREDKAGQHQQANDTLQASIRTIGCMVERLTPSTAAHQRRVTELANALGQALEFEPHRLQGLGVAASLHDIGEVAVPRHLLEQPGTLEPNDEDQVRAHVELGAGFVEAAGFDWPVADMIRQHHEAWDGSGYPQGLAGQDILLEARIIVVADTVETIASSHPHSPAMGLAASGAALLEGRGTRFDPAVVEAFMRLMDQDGLPTWLAAHGG